jgi:hypothetical protein
MNTESRYEMIKAAAEKLAFRKKMAAQGSISTRLRKAKSWVNEGLAKDIDSVYNDAALNKLDENYNQWTDSASYAKAHYGERAEAVSKYDKDWD